MNNSLSFQLGTSVAQYLMQYGQKELNYDEFKQGIDFVMKASQQAKTPFVCTTKVHLSTAQSLTPATNAANPSLSRSME